MRANFLKRILSKSTEAAPLPFEFNLNTANTSTGSSTTTQFKLPLVSTGTYNMVVNWGDGNSDTITTWNAAATTHTYSASGTYTISITGTCTGWRFANTGDRLKFISVNSWGILNISTDSAFYGCANFTGGTYTDNPTISTTSMAYCFSDCGSFNGDIGGWNMSTVTNMSYMMQQCSAWNNGGSASINNWNVSNVTTFLRWNYGITPFNQPIGNWNVGNVTTFKEMLYNTNFDQDISNWNVSNCIDFSYMFAGGSGGVNGFDNGGSDGINNWVFKSTGTINMEGMFYGTKFNRCIGSWNVGKVTNMKDMFYNCRNFNNGSNTYPLSAWDVSLVTTFRGMFAGNNITNSCKFNRDISAWTTTSLANLQNTFAYNTAFNQPIGSWNTASVNTMLNTFAGASAFNQNIGAWNVTACTTFTEMFHQASSFNNGGSSDINNWVIRTAGNVAMRNMFSQSLFNQPIGNWNVSMVTEMGSMFQQNTAFNQNIGAWRPTNCSAFNTMFSDATAFNNGGSDDINGWTFKTSGTINMSGMFGGSSTSVSCKFNRNITSWTTTYVTNMSSMFYFNTSFNQAIGSWNTQNVTNMGSMFYGATAFNQNIGAWDVSKVTSFDSMFKWSGAAKLIFNNGGSSDINNWIINSTTSVSMYSMFRGTEFNQPIGNWNMSKVFTVFEMLRDTIPFNQNIGSWNMSACLDFTNFMLGKTNLTFSTTNLDAIYNGWIAYELSVSEAISFGTAKYTAAASAGRALLTRANTTINVTGTADNGGLIRVTATGHGRSTGDKVFIKSVGGTTNANGLWTVTVVDANTLELQGSTYNAAWTSGGTVRTGYGWTITDGGL